MDSKFFIIVNNTVASEFEGTAADARKAANLAGGYAIKQETWEQRQAVSQALSHSLEGIDDLLAETPVEKVASPAFLAAVGAAAEWRKASPLEKGRMVGAALVELLKIEQGRPGTITKGGKVTEDSVSAGVAWLQGKTGRNFGLELGEPDAAGFSTSRQHFVVALAAWLKTGQFSYRRSELSWTNLTSWSK